VYSKLPYFLNRLKLLFYLYNCRIKSSNYDNSYFFTFLFELIFGVNFYCVLAFFMLLFETSFGSSLLWFTVLSWDIYLGLHICHFSLKYHYTFFIPFMWYSKYYLQYLGVDKQKNLSVDAFLYISVSDFSQFYKDHWHSVYHQGLFL